MSGEEENSRKRPRDEEVEGGDDDRDDDEAKGGSRPKKKKYALIFGYSGEAYHGLQLNMDDEHPTIEAVLLKACHTVGLVSDENFAEQKKVHQKIQWQRASRTDKGVHALRNVISAKFLSPPDGELACVKRLNAALPDDIRVYDLQPATGSFNSYLFCSGRKYDYYLPTYGLMPYETYQTIFPPAVAPEWPTTDDIVSGKDENNQDSSPPEGWNDRMYLFKSVPDSVLDQLHGYRINADTLSRTRRLFQTYCGTKMFHNFTPGGSSADASMHRYIRSIEVSDPFVHEGVEWVKISLDGQSFMLNQIRKMIGCVATVLASDQKDDFVAECLEKKVKRGIPMAPANGLLLIALDFQRYNKGLERVQGNGDNATGKKPVLLDEEHHKSEDVEYIRSRILGVIAKKEKDEVIMSRWMRSVRHSVRLAWERSIP